MAETALLETRALKKIYLRKKATPVVVLGGVDIRVEKGERIAIVGKSGAGKSTLLHILGTLEAPSEGEVLFEGRRIFHYSDSALSAFRNRELGFVFQFHYLLLEFTALENIMMPALISGQSEGKARKKAAELLKRVGLSDRATHKPSQLSGGEQQRVAIARALVMGPKLLLTDEMTGNLDSVTGRQIFDLVGELHREYGMALISVTHDLQLAEEYDHVLRLSAGSLVEKSEF